MDKSVQQFCVIIVPLLLAIILHEIAHGWIAKQLGDDTAKILGRLSLNPIKHIDPIGTVLVPGILLFSSYLSGGPGFLFGWAKPVPVNWARLGNPRRDMALVAVAGPTANFFMAIGWALAFKLAVLLNSPLLSEPLALMARMGIHINLILMILNLLPLLPLDGGRIVASLLPLSLARQFNKLEPYGFLILIAMLFTGVLGSILQFPLATLVQFVTGIASL